MADQPIRLLIVDDIQSTRDNLRKLLSFEDDIQVVGTAGDGKEGVEEAQRLRPDIVLTDVNMPLMDGIQLTEQLTQDLPSSPVIIMSVQGERDYLRRAMQAGAREFLIKPFSHDELVAAIRRVYAVEQKKGTFLTRADGRRAGGRPRAHRAPARSSSSSPPRAGSASPSSPPTWRSPWHGRPTPGSPWSTSTSSSGTSG